MEGLLEVQNLTKRFGGVVAVNNLSFKVEKNSITGLIGPNGSGKTVTFNLITGIYKPDGGTIYFKGEKLNGLKPHEIASRGIGRTFQLVKLLPNLTVLENALWAAQNKTIWSNMKSLVNPSLMRNLEKMNEERALKLLREANLIHLKDEYAKNLSYGQQKLLQFICVLLMNPEPELILLDEIAAGINPTMIQSLMEYIRKLNKAGKTFLIVEHNIRFIMNLCDKVIVLDHGEKIAEGKPEEIQNNARVLEAYFGH
ncbi:MAG: ABC transporter ATP-binding protein [Candidatus Hecatellales archaeon]|nr:MAG: ABC transporter ATP-binding protein [Candidatus Hecatellales archaeon]